MAETFDIGAYVVLVFKQNSCVPTYAFGRVVEFSDTEIVVGEVGVTHVYRDKTTLRVIVDPVWSSLTSTTIVFSTERTPLRFDYCDDGYVTPVAYDATKHKCLQLRTAEIQKSRDQYMSGIFV